MQSTPRVPTLCLNTHAHTHILSHTHSIFFKGCENAKKKTLDLTTYLETFCQKCWETDHRNEGLSRRTVTRSNEQQWILRHLRQASTPTPCIFFKFTCDPLKWAFLYEHACCVSECVDDGERDEPNFVPVPLSWTADLHMKAPLN